MIYNLVQYLTTELVTTSFVANGWMANSPQNSVLVKQSGGDVKHFYERSDWRVQILSRAENIVTSKEQIELVYAKLKNKFGLLLPQVTVNGIIFAAVKTYQISPIQVPGYLGADEMNLEMWAFNLIITTT